MSEIKRKRDPIQTDDYVKDVDAASPKKKKKKSDVKQNGEGQTDSTELTATQKPQPSLLSDEAFKLTDPSSPASVQDSDAEVVPSSATKKKYRNPSKAIGGSYLHHIGALLVTPILQRAEKAGCDPRTASLSVLRDLVGSPFKDLELQRLGFLLSQEFPQSMVAFPNIISTIRPLVRVNLKAVQLDLMKAKYKNEIPKLPRSAFQFYLTMKITKLKKKHPALNGWGCRTALTEKWTNMSPEQKAKYEQKYKRTKERYEKDVEQFCKDHPDIASLPDPIPATPRRKMAASGGSPAIKTTRTPRLTKKDKLLMSMTEEERRQYELNEQAPKPPLTSYVLFCKAKRGRLTKKNAKLSSMEIAQKLGQKWTAMDDSYKAKYKEMYQEQLEVFHKDIVEYYKSRPEAVPPPKTAKLLEKLKKSKQPKPKVLVDSDLDSSDLNSEAEDTEDDDDDDEGDEPKLVISTLSTSEDHHLPHYHQQQPEHTTGKNVKEGVASVSSSDRSDSTSSNSSNGNSRSNSSSSSSSSNSSSSSFDGY